MERKRYYVSLQSKEISQVQVGNNADFTIYATDAEIRTLRNIFNAIETAEMGTFWRAHVPFKPYHDDTTNDTHDKRLTEAFQLLYELGDEQAKQFIEQSGVLHDRPIDTDLL
ncbi:MAG TPA: hydrolase [Pseudogracilibacillus sp.]|nr:hydrolase [Pseudogracilibacillus sp.]